MPLTLGLTLGAFLLGTVVALPMAMIRIARPPVLSQATTVWIEFFRTTPPLIHIFWPYYVFPVVFDLHLSAVTVVILALAANTSAQMAEIFRAAGAEWRESGCSLCLAMNGDRVEPGEYAVSTTNRNFEGRQGAGARTFLASPATAAASAVRGRIADARELEVHG